MELHHVCFQYNLLKQAKKENTLFLPEGNDDRVLIAISRLQRDGCSRSYCNWF